MKRVYILFLTITCLAALSSCDDYLTVEPKDMVTVDKALSNPGGYTSALIGVYQILQNVYNPSGFMMGGGVDNFANIYTEPGSGFSPALNSNYNFDFANTSFDNGSGASFLNLYQAISNLNILIENIETKNVLSGEERDFILGEAKALRGFIHFDLWRVYGTMPGDGVGNSEQILPYSTEFARDLITYSNYSDFFNLLLKDLTEGRDLLAVSDPILKYSKEELNNIGYINEYEGLGWYRRQNRFNYYAVTATLARVSLWMGNNTDAYIYAKEVIDAVDEDGTSKFDLGTSVELGNQDFALFSEQLFGIQTSDYDDDIYSAYNAYCVTDEYSLADIYPSMSDIRRINLFTTLTSNALTYNAQISKKYSHMSENDDGYKSFPVIRLSEMYLIMIETATSLNESQTFYDTFVNSRFDNPLVLNESNIQGAVLDQYIREFWAEGQVFYAYKRMGLPELPISGQEMNADKYRVQIPTGETTGDVSM